MAESFFLRAQVTSNGTTFAQTTIPLGSYVDVLGQAILKIHGVYPAVRNAGNNLPYDMGLNNVDGSLSWQLTTQTQTEIQGLTDKSVIASGGVIQSFDNTPKMIMSTLQEDMNVQNFSNGYLVATEDIYLGVDRSTTGGDECDVDVILECSVTKMSTSKALALALSQQ
tara:strand:- start:181 stop:684 length:504 start_codon:yes stop_codon:yes gene_type:complete